MGMTDKRTITPISQLPPWHVICNTTFTILEASIFTCVQMATLTLHPNDVLTARGERPKPEKRVENAVVRLILGLSSATTTQFLTQVRFTPLDWKKANKKTISSVGKISDILLEKFLRFDAGYRPPTIAGTGIKRRTRGFDRVLFNLSIHLIIQALWQWATRKPKLLCSLRTFHLSWFM